MLIALHRSKPSVTEARRSKASADVAEYVNAVEACVRLTEEQRFSALAGLSMEVKFTVIARDLDRVADRFCLKLSESDATRNLGHVPRLRGRRAMLDEETQPLRWSLYTASR